MPIRGDKQVVKFIDHSKEARAKIFDIVMEATTDVFVDEIAPAARALSPVGDQPVREGEKRNRDSIEVKVFGTKKGPGAKIYTTSGHGGFLEMGTKKMGPQPYIYPAVQGNLQKIPERVRDLTDAEKLEKPKLNGDA